MEAIAKILVNLEGQARAISGFTTVYRTTRENRYLETTEKCVEYFLNNLPADKVPSYDFKDPNKDIPKDSSAAAIAASGLLDLFNATFKKKHKTSAYEILRSLSTRYLSRERGHQGLLLRGCSNKNKGSGIDTSLIYGDYYFMDSLTKI